MPTIILPGRSEFTEITDKKWRAILKSIKKGKYPNQNPENASDEVWRKWWKLQADKYEFAKVEIRGNAKKISQEAHEELHSRAKAEGMTIGQYWNMMATLYFKGESRYRKLNPNGCPNCRETHAPEVPEGYHERAEDFNPWEELEEIMGGEE